MLQKNLKIAWRNFRKYPLSSFLNTMGLTIGIAGALFIGCYAWQELTYDQFFPESERTYRVISEVKRSNRTDHFASSSPPIAPALVDVLPDVERMTRIRVGETHLVAREDMQFYEDRVLFVDSTFFEIFPFPLQEGDLEAILSQPDALVLTKKMARKYFPDGDALGQVLSINETQQYQVRGIVNNEQVHSHLKFDILLPFPQFERQISERDFSTEWGWVSFYSYVRIAKGIDPKEVESEIPGLLASHTSEDIAERLQFKLEALPEIYLGERLMNGEDIGVANSRLYVHMLIAAGILLLLISCINYINLTTAQAKHRSLETGLRKILGARKGQLIQQHLTESGLLIGFAFMGALALLFGMSQPLKGILPEIQLPDNYWLEGILFTLTVLVLTTLLAGVYPAYFIAKFKTVAALKNKLPHQKGALKFRNTLVIGQFVISSVLLIAAVVIFQQLNFMQSKDLGFGKEEVLLLPLRSEAERLAYPTLKKELLNQSGIHHVSAARLGLDGGYGTVSFRAEGRGEERVGLRLYPVHFDFVETLQMELLEGRSFSEDRLAEAESGFVINEAAARSLGWEPPFVGKALEAMDYAPGERQVIGVVKDFNYTPLHEKVGPLVLFYRPENHHFMYVRTRQGALSENISQLKAIWEHHLPDRPFEPQFLDERIAQQYGAEQRFAGMIGLFTGLTFLVALLGLFGLTAFIISQRTKEIGIRKVLGASISAVLVLLSKDFLQLVVIALFIASPIAWYLMSHWLDGFAYRIGISWWVFGLAAMMSMSIALVTISFQCLKVALANPVEALKSE